MQLFLDTADVAVIKEWAPSGLIDGITTNPTHLSKQSRPPLDIIKEIVSLLPNADISVEVTEQEPDAVYQQALKIRALAENIVVKIPCHRRYFSIIDKLTQEEVPLNITLVFSPVQLLAMAKLGVLYVSPFVGRIDDIGYDGMQLVQSAVDMMHTYEYETQVLAASIRSVHDLIEAMQVGAHAVTIPPQILAAALQHPLTDAGIEQFLSDWKKLGVRSFP